MSAKVVDIDIEYAQEALMSSGEYALDGKRFKIVQNRYRNRKRR
ncbi:hypothetical protein AGMMS49950_04110 [Endomicrobiia bacterium]|nr:hypothetical protein AGMMS49556_03480 [Endomicrobiia bacterium]GHT70045.1 hypothetical protein AGMMS49950_04110 [Endomicrobiia bacterium]